MYGPAFELMENEPVPGKEEYLNSEKYEIKNWDLDRPGHLRDIIKKVNIIRRENTALQDSNNIQFLKIENEYLLGFLKTDKKTSNTILVLINMDPYAHQAGRVTLPLEDLNISARQSFLAHELLTDTRLFWQGENHTVTIDPDRMPAQIYRIQRRVKREKDFDYFM